MAGQRPARTVPRHLGLILDGNRRWARAQGLPQLEGHRRGYQNLHRIVVAAVERGVEFVSAYVFSTENWNRAQEEVDYLMDLLVNLATTELDKYLREEIRLVFVGSRARLSGRVLAAVRQAEERSRHLTRGTAVLCLNYGGQTELAEGVARLVRDGVLPGAVTPEKLSQYLYHPEVPPVDFVIRTSGEQRISNFMLWRLAYAELYFTAVHWPGFTVADLEAALAEFAARQRRFGN